MKVENQTTDEDLAEGENLGDGVESDFEATPPDQVDVDDQDIESEEEEGQEEYEERRIFGLSLKQVVIGGLGVVILFAVLMLGLLKMAGSHGAGQAQTSYGMERGAAQPVGQAHAVAHGGQGAQQPVSQPHVGLGQPVSGPTASASSNVSNAAEIGPSEEPAPSKKLLAMVNDNGHAVLSLHKTVKANSASLATLVAEVAALKSQLASLTNGNAKAPSSAAMSKLHEQISALQNELASQRARSHALSAKVRQLSARPVLPGWHVAAVTDRGAVLTGPGQIVQVVKPGDSFYGLRILKLLPGKGEIITSAGALREH